MNLEQGKYGCEYPCKDEPCSLPAFDWLELSELSPPLRVRVCAAHWMQYHYPEQTYYTLPPDPPTDTIREAWRHREESMAQPETRQGVVYPEALKDLDELLKYKETILRENRRNS